VESSGQVITPNRTDDNLLLGEKASLVSGVKILTEILFFLLHSAFNHGLRIPQTSFLE
jgi:hypothetical protein